MIKTQPSVVQVGTETPATQFGSGSRDMAEVAVVEHPHEDEEHGDSYSQLVERQFRKETDPSVQEGAPGPGAAKIGRSQWDHHAHTNDRKTRWWKLQRSQT